jgi:hypothetical protein
MWLEVILQISNELAQKAVGICHANGSGRMYSFAVKHRTEPFTRVELLAVTITLSIFPIYCLEPNKGMLISFGESHYHYLLDNDIRYV